MNGNWEGLLYGRLVHAGEREEFVYFFGDWKGMKTDTQHKRKKLTLFAILESMSSCEWRRR